jgi:hypothetical protein
MVCSFFYVTGFGIPQEVVDRQFGIGKEVFDVSRARSQFPYLPDSDPVDLCSQEPFDIKAKHAADLANGGYNGTR